VRLCTGPSHSTSDACGVVLGDFNIVQFVGVGIVTCFYMTSLRGRGAAQGFQLRCEFVPFFFSIRLAMKCYYVVPFTRRRELSAVRIHSVLVTPNGRPKPPLYLSLEGNVCSYPQWVLLVYVIVFMGVGGHSNLRSNWITPFAPTRNKLHDQSKRQSKQDVWP